MSRETEVVAVPASRSFDSCPYLFRVIIFDTDDCRFVKVIVGYVIERGIIGFGW